MSYMAAPRRVHYNEYRTCTSTVLCIIYATFYVAAPRGVQYDEYHSEVES